MLARLAHAQRDGHGRGPDDAAATRYASAIGRAIRSVATPEAIKARGRVLGDFLLALDESRDVRAP